jgi:hypothetical protein
MPEDEFTARFAALARMSAGRSEEAPVKRKPRSDDSDI